MRSLRKKSRHAHDLFTYLVTCPHANIVGLFALSIAYVVDDLGWSRREVEHAFMVLEDHGLAFFDSEAAVAYVPAVLQWDPLSTEQQAKGAIRRLSSLPPTRLLERFKNDLIQQEGPNLRALRPLLDYLGVTGVRPESDSPSDPGLTVTPSPSPSPTPSPSRRDDDGDEEPAVERRAAIGHTKTEDFEDGAIPRTPAEELVDDLILPNTGEYHLRDNWLKALRSPGALAAAETAWSILNATMTHTEIHNPGAFLWSKFRELLAKEASPLGD